MPLTRTEVKNLLLEHEIHPKKSLGQNFVVEPNTIRQIIKLADLDPGDFVLEVGAGLGSLTLALQPSGGGAMVTNSTDSSECTKKSAGRKTIVFIMPGAMNRRSRIFGFKGYVYGIISALI